VQCFKYALTGLPSSYSDSGPKRLRTAYQEPYQEPRATRYPAHAATAAGYPQRPGEQKCSFYMRTAKCSYGPGCKFDHPAWVPPEGIPGWKEVRIRVCLRLWLRQEMLSLQLAFLFEQSVRCTCSQHNVTVLVFFWLY
jgi:hypothetical protein